MMTPKQREMAYRAVGYLQNTMGADSADAIRAALAALEEADLALAKAPIPDAALVERTAWTYWVSFNHQSGSGACAVKMASPVRTGADVGIMADFIKSQHGLTQVAIVNFILLENE